MHSTNTRSLTKNRGGLFRALTMVGLLAACGGSPEDQREQLRADAEREFGRPSDQAPTTSEKTPADAPAPSGDSEGARDPVVDPVAGDPAEPPATSGGSDAGESSDDPGATSGSGTADEGPATAEDMGDPAAEQGDSPAAPSQAPVTEPAAGQEPAAAPLLADADAAYSSLSSLRAAFVQRVDLPLVDRTAQGHGTWYQEGRDRFRMDFIDPPDDVFVADGDFLWLYQPSATPGQVIKSSLAGGSQAAGGADVLARILSEARASYDALYEGTAIVSGVRTHVIALTPRGPSDYRRVRVWIADGDRLVRRFRIEEQNETIRTVTLADLEPNVDIDDGLFSFVVPEGVQVFDREDAGP